LTGNPELIEQYRRIHETSAYGTSSVKNLRFIRPEIRLLRPASILDYGCGQSHLLDMLDLGYPAIFSRYDPAIPKYADKPARVFDLLINVDVLEHIEDNDLDAVIEEMRALGREALIIVDTKPATKLLPDGRNAHVTIRPHGWWRERLSAHFGPLEPMATARRSRAGFRTWRRSHIATLSYMALRAEEELRYWSRRAAGRSRYGIPEDHSATRQPMLP
jgi:SAM-dependent methyltransferase